MSICRLTSLVQGELSSWSKCFGSGGYGDRASENCCGVAGGSGKMFVATLLYRFEPLESLLGVCRIWVLLGEPGDALLYSFAKAC